MKTQSGRWAIVLAGGEGERLRRFIESRLGVHRPKQYCTFMGERSMLQHTVDRASGLVFPGRILTVIGQNHSRYLGTLDHPEIPGRVIEQPENLGTATGVLLAAAYVMAADPLATVLIFPSDHFVFPEDRFRSNMEKAVKLSENFPEHLVLLGAKPNSPEPAFGWIEPGRQVRTVMAEGAASRVASFHEKPAAEEARAFFSHGYMWNTMIIVASVSALWKVSQRTLPGIMRQFDPLLQLLKEGQTRSISGADESDTVCSVFKRLEMADFSRHVLQKIPGQSLLMPMGDVDWNDWGCPSRIFETFRRYRKASRRHSLSPRLSPVSLGLRSLRISPRDL